MIAYMLGPRQRRVTLYSALAFLSAMALWSVIGTIDSLPSRSGQLLLDILWDIILVAAPVLLFLVFRGNIQALVLRGVIVALCSVLLIGTGIVVIVFMYSIFPPLILFGALLMFTGIMLSKCVPSESAAHP